MYFANHRGHLKTFSLDLGRAMCNNKKHAFHSTNTKDRLHTHAEQRIKGCSPQFRFDSGQWASARRALVTRED